MTWRRRYLIQSDFLSTTSLAWSLALHLLFCFSQEKPLWWKVCEQDFNFHLNRTAPKMSEYRVFYGLCFPLFGLNTEIYRVNFRVQSKCGKVQTRKNSVFEHFSRSARFSLASITLWNKPSRHGVLTVAELRFSKSLWSMVSIFSWLYFFSFQFIKNGCAAL